MVELRRRDPAAGRPACCAARGSLPAPLRVACLDAGSIGHGGFRWLRPGRRGSPTRWRTRRVWKKTRQLYVPAPRNVDSRQARVAEDPDPTVRIARAQCPRIWNEQGAARSSPLRRRRCKSERTRRPASAGAQGIIKFRPASRGLRPFWTKRQGGRAPRPNGRQLSALRHLPTGSHRDALHDALKTTRTSSRGEACRAPLL